MTDIKNSFDTSSLKNRLHSKEEIYQKCVSASKDLKFIGGDGAALLFALSGCETSYGAMNIPRFELGYSRSAIRFKKSKILQSGHDNWGDLAACSWGPWQMMWVVAAELGYPLERSPIELWHADVSLPYVVQYVNECISRGATSVFQIGLSYNGGFGAITKPSPVVINYGKKLSQFYDQSYKC